jgi:hypothetical protein
MREIEEPNFGVEPSRTWNSFVSNNGNTASCIPYFIEFNLF